MSIDLSNLAGKATATRATLSIYDLPAAQAREFVKVVDGNKVPAKDGSQALTLRLGRRLIKMDVITAGATRIQATLEEAPLFAQQLLQAVHEGMFDEAIEEAQAGARESKAKRSVAVEEAAEVDDYVEDDYAEEEVEHVDISSQDEYLD